jgi:ubiquinone/menaquinone biosynthesis C-methylase UbiE
MNPGLIKMKVIPKFSMNVFSDHSIAESYDRFYLTDRGRSVDQIEKSLIRQHLNSILAGNMLELGCGTGHWTEFFCEEGFEVTAIDNSKAMLSLAKRKNISRAAFHKADAAHLPVPDNNFAVITSVTMLEFVKDINEIFNEIDRVLKPGGYLILGWLNALSEMGKNKNTDEIFKHAHFYSPADIDQLLSRFGVPQMSFGVYYSSGFELLDGTDRQDTVQPAFIATFVKKNEKCK